jgi:hypothetical protein
MASIKEPQPVLPFTGLLWRKDFDVNSVHDRLSQTLGDTIFRSETQPFTHTTYYNKEMGERILRQWWVFDKTCDPAILAAMKHTTNAIEQQHLDNQNNRRVNIDPGFITMSNVILASTKNYSHRIYLDQGIYAEVTLIFKGKTYSILDWTYPDYKEPATIAFFNRAREILKEKLPRET